MPELTLSDGRTVQADPPDIFDLALRGDVPNIVRGAVDRLVIAALAGSGIASADELAALETPQDGTSAVAVMRYLIEEGTTNPKLCSTPERARELQAEGVAVDLQARYPLEDLVRVYDAVMGRGGQLYTAWFPERADGAGQDQALAVGAVSAAAPGADAEPDAALPADGDVAGLAD